MIEALIFDCDGVIANTERDGHRIAFNLAFAERGYKFKWGVEHYGDLLKIAGGKERMRFHFEEKGWPRGVYDRDELIKELHLRKTVLYMEMVERRQLPLRPGVKRLVDEAIADGVALAVCSTSSQRAVELIVEKLFGEERQSKFALLLAGDIVSKKKPDPEIYNLARERLRVRADRCLVIEDSRNGLLAAKAAGLHCVITTSRYTVDEDFKEADAVFPELGDPPGRHVTLKDLQRIVAAKDGYIF